MGTDGSINATGEASPEEMLNQIGRLQEQLNKTNQDIQSKNEKILELIENIEDLKV